ncbi:MAG: HAMP domain-containing histidine kinase [Gemmatimonadetes bacterium]|nr:HAMP domain-containing histidine kinase [Gemmatimonadota bacterium]
MARAARDARRLADVLNPRTVWALAAIAAALTLVFAALVARHLTSDARRASALYARVFAGLASPGEQGATAALLALAAEIRREGIPIVVTDAAGAATDTANLPRPMALGSRELRAFVAALDRTNPPVVEPAVGTIHYGAPPARRYLRLVFALEVAALLSVVAAGLVAYRAALRAARDRVWVAMARESAHQLGTPLTSLAGWIERLRSGPGSAAEEIAGHLDADYARLERVSRRFERIGQPPRRDRVDLAALAEGVAAYFRPRLPSLANRVTLTVRAESAAPVTEGDPLLLEWALEALLKNAVDALKGRSGAITVAVTDEPDEVVLTVSDDGPGVPRDLRHHLFQPGASTKTGGWGLGLTLARRIVEESHGGRVTLESSAVGARFAIRLRRGEPTT